MLDAVDVAKAFAQFIESEYNKPASIFRDANVWTSSGYSKEMQREAHVTFHAGGREFIAKVEIIGGGQEDAAVPRA